LTTPAAGPLRPAGLTAHVGRRRADRQQAFAHEDWASWWAAVAHDAELTDLLAERHRRTTTGIDRRHACPSPPT
jgi:hypothetical protein